MQDCYQVVVVKFGTRSTRKSDVYLNFDIYDIADDPIDMDYYFWVLQNERHTVVVDTGFSQVAGIRRKRTSLINPAEAFAALGVSGDDAPDVVITHAHYDHAGNLDLFPSSRVIMSQAEYEFWTSPLASRKQFAHIVEEADLRQIVRAHDEERLTTFSGHMQLTPGVELIEVGGHTPGQIVVKVLTSEGNTLLASDAIHYYEEYEADMPFMLVADLPRMYSTFDTIRSMMDDDVRYLVPGHDPSTLGRFTPVPHGRLSGIAATIGSLKKEENTTL